MQEILADRTLKNLFQPFYFEVIVHWAKTLLGVHKFIFQISSKLWIFMPKYITCYDWKCWFENSFGCSCLLWPLFRYAKNKLVSIWAQVINQTKTVSDTLSKDTGYKCHTVKNFLDPSATYWNKSITIHNWQKLPEKNPIPKLPKLKGFRTFESHFLRA